MLRKAGYTITGVPNISNGFFHSVSDPESPVKLRITDQTETRRNQEPEVKNMYGLHVIEEMNNPNSDTSSKRA